MEDMQTARIFNDGKLKLPEFIRATHNWEIGQELIIMDSDEGIFLTSKAPFEPTTLDEVAGCLKYKGRAKTLEDMENAVAKGVAEAWRDENF